MSLITETDLKKATGEKTLPGLVKWCNKNDIRYFNTRNGIMTTESVLNKVLSELAVCERDPNMSKIL